MIFVSYPDERYVVEIRKKIETPDNDYLKGEIENIAMKLESDYGVLFRCADVYEEKDGDIIDLS